MPPLTAILTLILAIAFDVFCLHNTRAGEATPETTRTTGTRSLMHDRVTGRQGCHDRLQCQTSEPLRERGVVRILDNSLKDQTEHTQNREQSTDYHKIPASAFENRVRPNAVGCRLA
jgi:hypothetical protein